MAKLHNYYILCPLIDQKSFLGVAENKEDEHVIVTLGRNVVNKYRVKASVCLYLEYAWFNYIYYVSIRSYLNRYRKFVRKIHFQITCKHNL